MENGIRHLFSRLEASENVFALVVKAQIHAKRIKDGTTRQKVKVGLIRLLFERNYNREQIVELFNIIDWMIQLPKVLEKDFVRIVYEIQEDKQMAYINTIERYEREVAVEEGMKQGVQQGRKEGMQLGTQALLKSLLQIKFGTLPEWAIQQLQQASQEQLEQWAGAILTAESLEAVLKQS